MEKTHQLNINALPFTQTVKVGILSLALLSPGVSLADEDPITISPFISQGSVSESSRGALVEPNLWFFINNNQSMTKTYHSDPFRMAYHPKVTYKIPYRVDGSPLPEPRKESGKWTVYEEPFKDSLTRKNADLETNEDEVSSTCDNRTGDDAKNCRIWENYYRHRLLAVKSVLSVMLKEEAEKFKGIRVGYNQHSPDNFNEHPSQITPVITLESSTNMEKFKKWFYGLDDYSEDERILTSIREMVDDIQEKSLATNKHHSNPLITDPSKPYDKDTNKLLACHSNHLIVLSDDEWSESFGDDGYGPKMEEMKTQDGKGFLNIAPYKRKFKGYSDSPGSERGLADIAFHAWATDLDGDSTNNTEKTGVPPRYPEVDGKVQTLNGDKYNHPYNDPATWQHLNMHTIGFDIKPKHMFRINPPKGYTTDASATPPNLGIEDKLLASDWVWKFDGLNSLSTHEIPMDLASAALVSRGRFYNSTNPDSLKDAILDILDLIKQTTVSNIDGVKASGGALANTLIGGNSFYATSYDENFAGDLVRRNLYDGKNWSVCFDQEPQGDNLYGKICDKQSWDDSAAEKLKKRSDKRRIITVKRENDQFIGQDFDADDLTDSQKERLKGKDGLPDVFDQFDEDERLEILVDYIKGDQSKEGEKKLRKRDNILGAITRSSPYISGIPQVSQLHPDKQSDSYINFVTRYLYKEKKDKEGNSMDPPVYESLCQQSPDCSEVIKKEDVDIVYVGANDGMLHAFRATDGSEIFAYVPDAVYENLSKLTDQATHKISFIDGNIGVVVVGDKQAGWKKQLVASMGGGAKGLFSLNVTNPVDADTDEIVLWEFTDKDSDYIGNIIGMPAIVQLNDGTWAVVIGNGYNSKKGQAALIVIDAKTGKKIQEIVLPDAYAVAGKPNGLAPAFFQVFPNKNSNSNGIDRAYAGDLQGNLWVFDFTDAGEDGGITVVNNKPLFTAKYQDKEGHEVRQPITVAPLVRQHPIKYGNLVHFGTGALFEENDLSSDLINSIYAVWDDWIETGIENGGGLPRPRSCPVERTHLRKIEFTHQNGGLLTTVGGKSIGGRLLKPQDTGISWKTTGYAGDDCPAEGNSERGWRIDLPLGERAWQSPYYTFGANNVVAIGYDTVHYDGRAIAPSEEITEKETDLCSVDQSKTGVISWQMAFNMNDATKPLPSFGTLDVDGDSQINQKDQIKTDEDNTADGDDDTSGKKTVNLTALQQNGVNLTNRTLNTFSPLVDTGNDSSLCSFITQSQESNTGEITSKQLCRESHTGTWVELK